MPTTILSQGPSAKLCRSRPRGTLIAVNAMAAAWPADWWVFADAETFLAVRPLGAPTIFCKAAVLTDLAEMSPSGLAELLARGPRLHEGLIGAKDDEDVGNGHDDFRGDNHRALTLHPRDFACENRLARIRAVEPRWNRWSGTAALALAIALDDGPLLLRGYDMHGDADALGSTRVTRDEPRWRQEREVFDHLLTLAKAAGLKPTHLRER
ncbi:MAG: hypothetical protein NTW19_02515 [Planctomycetota bacterium]|nr:hypothetical protein [Planctomycetota bacterium]